MTDKFISSNTKRSLRRKFKRRRKAVENLGQQADQNIDKLLLRRFNRLTQVRKFVGLWLALFLLLFLCGVTQLRSLSPYYQTLQPAAGGIYSEGLVGTFSNANPIYANGAADSSISRLVFSGLFTYDQDDRLVGDLASSWKTDDKHTTYTVNLRQDVRWHDGAPLTSADVVFTYSTIQNTEAQSPLFSSWQNITVSADGPYRVKFVLPNPLSSFIYQLNGGILPKHLLHNIPPAQLRSASFNAHPVGTGPFRWRSISVIGGSESNRRQEITLAPNKNYHRGTPKLGGFNLSIYRNDQQMVRAFEQKQINAMSGLDSAPSNLSKDSSVQVYNTPLNAIVMAFFNNSKPILNDKAVRQALVTGVDRSQLVSLLGYPSNLVDGPLLPSQITYNKGNKQLSYNLAKAQSLLKGAGWEVGEGGQRYKDNKPLTINLVSESTPDYVAAAKYLQQQWNKLGVRLVVTNSSSDDLQGGIIPNHDYDILLYGIEVGVDPDVFAYWDSSQASVDSQGHSNLSEYKSTDADQDLQSARTRESMKVRIPKYQHFLKTWKEDAPALALYQPTYLYITRGPVFNYQRIAMDSAADRFNSVADWMIREERQTH